MKFNLIVLQMTLQWMKTEKYVTWIGINGHIPGLQ